jgi:hypothetical protein
MKALANGSDADTVLGDGGVHGEILADSFKFWPAFEGTAERFYSVSAQIKH